MHELAGPLVAAAPPCLRLNVTTVARGPHALANVERV